MDERLKRIRESERKSHTEIYTNEKLYSSDSWLQKPIKTVKEILALFEEYNDLKVFNSHSPLSSVLFSAKTVFLTKKHPKVL